MKQNRSASSRVWVAVGGAGVVLGLAVAWACLAALRPEAEDPPEVVVEPEVSAEPPDGDAPVEVAAGGGSGQGAVAADCAAMQYARAVQSGDADEMMGLLAWVRERLERVGLETSDPAEQQAARERVAALLVERNVEGNQLRAEGIEDQYVFVPGAVLEVAGVDEGRDNLEHAVKERTWIRVTYSRPSRSPLDRDGQAIRSLLVGVNIDREDRVLKAGILGNLDVDKESMEYWMSAQGE